MDSTFINGGQIVFNSLNLNTAIIHLAPPYTHTHTNTPTPTFSPMKSSFYNSFKYLNVDHIPLYIYQRNFTFKQKWSKSFWKCKMTSSPTASPSLLNCMTNVFVTKYILSSPLHFATKYNSIITRSEVFMAAPHTPAWSPPTPKKTPSMPFYYLHLP